MFIFKQKLSNGSFQVITDRDSDKLTEKVMAFRTLRGIKPVDRKSVYNEIYNQLQSIPQPRRRQPKISLRGALEATRAAIKGTFGRIVPQEEINRRAKICEGCIGRDEFGKNVSMLQPLKGCTG